MKGRKPVTCSSGCEYNGIDDENGYFLCKCGKIEDGNVNNYFTNSVFKQFRISNFNVFLCFENIDWEESFTSRILFVLFMFLVYVVGVVVSIATLYRSIYSNIYKILHHEGSLVDVNKIIIDQIGFSPSPQVGNPKKNKKKKLQVQNYIQGKDYNSNHIIIKDQQKHEEILNLHVKNEVSNQKINSRLPVLTKINNLQQLNSIPILLQIEIDNRKPIVIYYHELIYNHEILNLIYYNSVINPFFIRLTTLVLCLLLKLGTSSLFFSDSYIKESNDYKKREGEANTAFIFVVTIQIMRVLWPIIITVLVKNILNYTILIPKDVNQEMKKYLIGDYQGLKQGE